MNKEDFNYFTNSAFTYLDNAATTQKPKVVVEAITDYYNTYCANTHRSNHGDANKATTAYENARKTLKEFINAQKLEEIIFTKGVTESINFIAHSYAKKFKTVIISSLEHHSNIVPWHLQGRHLGAGLEVVKYKDNLEFDFEDYERLLKNNPNSFVSITHISNAFGKIHDIKRAIKLAHNYGAKILIDAAQSMAHFKIDVKDLNADFVVLSSHKTFGPTGVGAVYIKEDLLKDVTPYQTGGATINEVDFDSSTFLDSPYVFEAGTQNIAGVIGFAKALYYVSSIGYEKMHENEQELYNYLYEELSKIEGIIFYNDLDNAIGARSFNIEGIVHDDIGILLDKQKVAVRVGHHCAQPMMKALGIKGTIRASLAFYNEKEDIDKFIKALNKALNMLRD